MGGGPFPTGVPRKGLTVPASLCQPSAVISGIRVATSLDSLEEHAEAWDRLLAELYNLLSMLSHAWVSSFLEHRDLGGPPWQCFFAYQDSELVGVLPLIGG